VRVHRYSPTQINKFASCPRKWGWEYLEGIRPPQKKAAALGEGCHTVLENWLQKGVAPDPRSPEGKIVMPALSVLPKPSPNLEIERWVSFTWGGHAFAGKVDLGYWAKADGSAGTYTKTASGRLWTVHDHKTTSDFMWALDEEQLLNDPQALIYSKEAIDRHEVDEVQLSWMYMRTRGKPACEPRRTIMTRPQIDSGMAVLKPYVDQMAELRRVHLPVIDQRKKGNPEQSVHQPGQDSPVLTLDYNAYECGAYDGCHFVDRCNLSRRERMCSIMAKSDQRSTLKERMQTRKAARGGAATVTQGTAANSPAINPPEQPSGEKAQAPMTEEEKAATTRRGRGRKNTEETAAPEQTSLPVDGPTEGAEAEEPRRGRGRPPKPATAKATEGSAAESAFVAIFSAAITAGGEERHLEAAEKAWGFYKKEFVA
jgi:hypothetical protein